MENFIEETSSLKYSEKNRKKYFIYTLVSYASLVVAILSLFFAPIFIKVKNGKITIVASGAGLIVNIATLVLTFGLFLFLHFLFLKKKNKIFVEYDYVFTGEKLAVSAIYNETKRSFIDKTDVKDIVKIGKITSGSYKKILSDPTVKKVKYFSDGKTEDGKKIFYVLYNGKNGKTCMQIEVSEKFMVAILKVTGKNVVEEDYE
ncbi:MAG TPA: hypothetical protein DHU65_06550 [Clostridiales bacterium]|nr:hypothetical protein [Clostridiales bacterium]